MFWKYRTHTHPFYGPLDFVWNYLGEPVPEPIWILLKQETVSGSSISWAICKSALRPRQITMPAPHHSDFLQPRCPSCCLTNSVKALKALKVLEIWVSKRELLGITKAVYLGHMTHCTQFLAPVKSRLVLVPAQLGNTGQSLEGHKTDMCVCGGVKR